MEYIVLVIDALPMDEIEAGHFESAELINAITSSLEFMPTVTLIRKFDNGEFVTVEFTDGNSIKFIASRGFVKFKNHAPLALQCQKANMILLCCDRTRFNAEDAFTVSQNIKSFNPTLSEKTHIIWTLIASDLRKPSTINEIALTKWQSTADRSYIPDIFEVRIDFSEQQVSLLTERILKIIKFPPAQIRKKCLALLPEDYLSMTPPLGSRPSSPGSPPPQAPPAPGVAHRAPPPLA